MEKTQIQILEEIDKISKLKKNRHSYFQLKHFILGKALTHQAKLHICVTELSVRKDSLESMVLEIEQQKDNLELFDLEIEHLKSKKEELDKSDTYNIRKNELKSRGLNRRKEAVMKKIANLKNTLQGTVEEANFFLVSYQQLSKIEKIKDWDDPELQLEYWDSKYQEEVNNRFMFGLPMDTELIKDLQALPNDARSKHTIIDYMQKKIANHKDE